jgi:DNA helicase-2/ATP-dependent DNA helicase PcrA
MPGVIPKTINAQQRRAIEHADGPLLIVAGAGTGKTTVITQRLAWLILQRGVKPHEVLALTFTEKAAGEMADRLDRILPYGYVELWVHTFHAFCEKILRAHALDVGLPSDFRLLPHVDLWLLIRRNLDRFDLDYYRPVGNPTRFIHGLLQHFSRAKDEVVTPADYLAYVEKLALDRDRDPSIAGLDGAARDMELKRLRELANAYAAYEKLLLDERVLDFGDLIVRTLQLFRERPQILGHYRKQFTAILVDEFQDTNWAQYELVKLLAAPANNLTVVGDDDQSIYKFRGASLANILQFKRDYPDASEVVLTTNYRSRQNLLDAAHAFIAQNNPNRLEAQLTGDAQGFTAPISKKLTATRKGVGIYETVVAETEAGEADAVVAKILELRSKAKAKWDDCAILVRANDHAEPFLAALDRAGVPYQFLASRGLYRKEIILDILAFLRLLDNYHESDALYRVLSFPFWNVPTSDLIELGAFARRKGYSLFEAARLSATIGGLAADGRSRIARVLGVVDAFTGVARTTSVSLVLQKFLNESGYLRAITSEDDAHRQTDLLLLNHFYRKVLEFEHASEEPSVRAFVAAVQMEREAGEEGALAGAFDEGPEAVKVMTVHGAKGLEFRFVFLVQLVDKRFPSVGRPEAIPLPDALVKEEMPEGDLHLEEERRLFYVAMTRARDGLFLTRAVDYGGARDKKPSRFLIELGLAKADQPDRRQRVPTIPRSPRAKAPPIEPAVAEAVERKVSFSFTELDTYESCPWKYRYAYVLAVPSGKGPQASFGTTVHATLYDFFHQIQERAGVAQVGLFGDAKAAPKSFEPPSLKDLLTMYEENWVDDWYESNRQREEYKKRGRDALTKFYESHKGKFPVPKYLEQNFSVNLDPYHFRGAIDRVDVITEAPKAGVEIVDYKTGAVSHEKLRRNKLQLSLYALAGEDPNVFNLKVEKLTFEYVEGGKRESVVPKPEDLAKARSWALGTIEKIKSGDFHATPGQVCRFCDFRSICPYRAV